MYLFERENQNRKPKAKTQKGSVQVKVPSDCLCCFLPVVRSPNFLFLFLFFFSIFLSLNWTVQIINCLGVGIFPICGSWDWPSIGFGLVRLGVEGGQIRWWCVRLWMRDLNWAISIQTQMVYMGPTFALSHEKSLEFFGFRQKKKILK